MLVADASHYLLTPNVLRLIVDKSASTFKEKELTLRNTSCLQCNGFTGFRNFADPYGRIGAPGRALGEGEVTKQTGTMSSCLFPNIPGKRGHWTVGLVPRQIKF